MSRIVSEDAYDVLQEFCQKHRERNYQGYICNRCPFASYFAYRKGNLHTYCDIEMEDGWKEVEDNE